LPSFFAATAAIISISLAPKEAASHGYRPDVRGQSVD
jgi:hypothetical protein